MMLVVNQVMADIDSFKKLLRNFMGVISNVEHVLCFCGHWKGRRRLLLLHVVGTGETVELVEDGNVPETMELNRWRCT